MASNRRKSALVGALLGATLADSAAGSASGSALTVADYDRAARFLVQNREKYVLNGEVTPHWLDGDRFWYRSRRAEGRSVFLAVNANTGAKSPAFDQAMVARGLSAALGRPIEPDRLPFQSFRQGAGGSVEAIVDDRLWRCGAGRPVCASSAPPKPVVADVASPDGKWLAFVRDDNIWIRPAAGGDAFALTTDGAPDHGWGAQPGADFMATARRLAGSPVAPAVLWSPDSKRLLIDRVDDRKVRGMALLQSVPTDGSVRPKVYTWRMAAPGEPDVSLNEPWVFDIATRTGVRIAVPAFPSAVFTPIKNQEVWWSNDGATIGLLVRDRYAKSMTLYAVDPSTGAARPLVSETGKTFIQPAPLGHRPMVVMRGNGDVLWFSERDGKGRLYLYGADGAVKRVFPEGGGEISSIVRLDDVNGRIWVRANGREADLDPYQTNLYRIDLNSGQVLRVTPEAADHEVGLKDDDILGPPPDPMAPAAATRSFSPDGRFFIDTFSTVGTPPVSVLRRADGTLVATLEKADISPLRAGGVTLPESFTARAADGVTPLYGVILRPSTFDPSRRYPVVDQIYPGPQVRRTPSDFMTAMFDPSFAQAVAELGFVVVLVDGRGTPGRSRAFLDQSYGKLSSAGFLEDHVAVIRELAESRPWMDLSKVGVYGTSGGGYAAARAMFTYPDVFKVGVANAGDHDLRGYLAMWAETYDGPADFPNDIATSNAMLARNLKGKLLLIHGDMDANVSPALTMQVVDALIKANKDFDMLVVPNRGHSWGDYATRVTWDYLVRNLMGADPPREYQIAKAEP